MCVLNYTHSASTVRIQVYTYVMHVRVRTGVCMQTGQCLQVCACRQVHACASQGLGLCSLAGLHFGKFVAKCLSVELDTERGTLESLPVHQAHSSLERTPCQGCGILCISQCFKNSHAGNPQAPAPGSLSSSPCCMGDQVGAFKWAVQSSSTPAHRGPPSPQT